MQEYRCGIWVSPAPPGVTRAGPGDAFIQEKPRTWYEILQRFAGQPYPAVYRAFGRLWPDLGRREDLAPTFPYTFADTEFTRAGPKPGS
jgi:hypothetical protein